jgi:hypothetical protein
VQGMTALMKVELKLFAEKLCDFLYQSFFFWGGGVAEIV